MYPYEPGKPLGDEDARRVPSEEPKRRGRGRAGATALLALALTGTAVGGGAIGAVAGTQWAQSEPVSGAQAQTGSLTRQPLQNGSEQSLTAASQVYNQVGGTVVTVQTSLDSRRGITPQGGGSGVVIDARGLILTNNHVVDGAESVSVEFANGEEREAEVLGTDSGNDLALLKVELPQDVPVASLGDSAQVQVGEVAIAIGSPFGLEQTVTQGIVSAVGRDWQGGYAGTQRDLIQTDAPINPGNSGGPLFNVRGEVIGINTLNESPVRGSVGVGFAVPANTAQELLPRLEAGEEIERAWLGIAGYELDQPTAREQGLDVEEGVLIVQVVPNGPADKAGLRGGDATGQGGQDVPEGGDVIVAVDGNPVGDMSELADQLADKQPGDTTWLTVVRDGRERQVNVTLGTWPDQPRPFQP